MHTLTCDMDGWCWGGKPEPKCCLCGAGLFDQHIGHEEEDGEPIMKPLTGFDMFLINQYMRPST